jgi:hypothetical protein
MTKLNKTQQLILDSATDGVVTVPASKRLWVRQAAKLVEMGLLNYHSHTINSTSYLLEQLDNEEIYEVLTMYRAKSTGKLARQTNGRYHLYLGDTHYVVLYDPQNKVWCAYTFGFKTPAFKTRKQAIDAIYQ